MFRYKSFISHLRNRKHFLCFHRVIETQVEVWKNEKLQWEHIEACRASVSTLFRVLPNFLKCFYNVCEHRKNIFYFFYKITRRKLKHRNSRLYRSVNSLYCSRWRIWWHIMVWTFPYSYRNTAFSQSKLTFSKCYFIIHYNT